MRSILLGMCLILACVFLASSCSTADARAQWKIEDVSDAKKAWRWCHVRLDGPQKHEKGMCYISQECRKRMLHKKECRPKPLFCAHGDLNCMRKYGIDKKKIR